MEALVPDRPSAASSSRPLLPAWLLVALACLLGWGQAKAKLTYDLRLVGGGKSVSSLGVGDVVNLELFAIVTGADPSTANDGFKEGYCCVSSSGGNVLGDLTVTLRTTFAASGAQNGARQDLDGDGDLDVGSLSAFQTNSANPAADSNYVIPRAASMQTTSGTPITNGREFKLADVTFKVTHISNPLDSTPVVLSLVAPNFKSPIDVEATWQEDGVGSSQILMPGGTFPNGFPETGTNVILKAFSSVDQVGMLDKVFGDPFVNPQSGQHVPTFSALALQPDGRLLVGGPFTARQARSTTFGLARLESNGSLDWSFAEGLAGTDAAVAEFALQPDGKILIAGAFTTVHGTPAARLARLQGNGKHDATFATPALNGAVAAVAVQPDGKVVIGGDFTLVNGTPRNRVARLYSDGSLDVTFASGAAGADAMVRDILLQADGEIVIGGGFANVNGTARGRVARLNADGTLDTTFGSGLAGADGVVVTLATADAGKIVIGGSFATVNGTTRRGVARLQANGALDTAFGNGLAGLEKNFNNAAEPLAEKVAVLADGRVWVAGDFGKVNGVSYAGLARLNADGSLDTSVPDPTAVFWRCAAMALMSNDDPVVCGEMHRGGVMGYYHRLHRFKNSDGTRDRTFDTGMVDGPVRALAVQGDGCRLLGGDFTSHSGTLPARIRRLKTDGTDDLRYAASLPGANDSVHALVLQADGKALIGGGFTTVHGQARARVARLLSDGRVDGTFGAGTAGADGLVRALAVQTDGKVLLGGDFATVNGAGRGRIARLNADGTLDSIFGSGLAGANGPVHAVAVQTDGKVLIGGSFSTVNGTARGNIARLNADGSLDITFGNGLAGTNDVVYAVAATPEGTLVGGSFTTVNTAARARLARLTATGALDSVYGQTLNLGSGSVRALAVRSDNKVIVAGNMLTRLTMDGRLDFGFGPVGAEDAWGPVLCAAVEPEDSGSEPDAGVIVGGPFFLNMARFTTGQFDWTENADPEPVLRSSSAGSVTANTATLAANVPTLLRLYQVSTPPTPPLPPANVTLKWFVRFQYGTTPVLGTTTAGQFSTGTVSTNLTGLAASTTYYYRCVAGNMGLNSGAVYGPIQTFTTSAGNPPAITNPASTSVASGARSLPFSFQVSASNGATAFSATGLPPGLSINTSTGVISGTPVLMGSYFATVTASNAAGSGSALLPISLISESQGWRQAWFGVNATNSGSAADIADPDNDNIPNLLERLFALDPANAFTVADGAALPAVGTEIISGTRYLTLTFRSSGQTQELAVELQTATAPNGVWESVAPSVTEVLGYDAITGNPIVRLKLALAAEDMRRFVRLKASSDEP